MNEFTLEYARQQDQVDDLAAYRDQFHLPKGKNGLPKIYFSGNSLGLQPKKTKDYIQAELEDWSAMGAKGHFYARNPWFHYHKLLKKGLAHLVGAQENEVVAMNSLTVNLHLAFVSFFRPNPERYKIVMSKKSFSSDRYAIQSQLSFHGIDPKKGLLEVGNDSGVIDPVELEELIKAHGHEVALIWLEGVSYISGQVIDVEAIVRMGHRYGCKVGFDLAHAIGNIPLKLHSWDVDFAVWCNYKYVNAGPGAVGGLFVHQRHGFDVSRPQFLGWWGVNEDRRFFMSETFEPLEGVDSFQLSNVPIISSAALRASLDLFMEAGMDRVRKKSINLTGYAEKLLLHHCKHRIRILTPQHPSQRGCQLSIVFEKNAKKIFQELLERDVSCDWREPNVIRIAPAPLYNSFEEVFHFVERLNQI